MLDCSNCGAGIITDDEVRPLRCPLCGGALRDKPVPKQVSELTVKGWCPWCEADTNFHRHTMIDGRMVENP